MSIDFRAAVKVCMVAAHGAEKGAQAALARRMAPRWSCSADSAMKRLSRWFSTTPGRASVDITSEPLALLLDELGIGLRMPRGRRGAR